MGLDIIVPQALVSRLLSSPENLIISTHGMLRTDKTLSLHLFFFERLKPTQVLWHMDPTSIANIARHCANPPHLIKQDTSMVRSV